MMLRCTHTDPGRPSVNHPDRPVVSAWQCVREQGHDGPHAPVAVCDENVVVRHKLWPCVLADGHEGEHVPASESGHLSKPLRAMDYEELIAAASLATAEMARRDASQLNERLRSWEAQVHLVASVVLGEVHSPHGNNHTGTCWRKYLHCLAFAIIGSGGLDRAVESWREDREP
jgi:hypothetical protein